jgi:UDP-3-O-[3-hydroxymyristoyl] glucosamine N-acyltransferase
MKINPHKLQTIAQIIGAEYVGNPEHLISGFNEIHCVEAGDVVFVDHPKYYDKALHSAATTILINKKVECPKGKALMIHPEPFTAFNLLTRHFQPVQYSSNQISATAVIGKNTVIMPGAFIGNNVIIGDNTVIHPNVVIYDHCKIGNNVVIHANSVIGADAFYFKKRLDHFEKLQSVGRVIIEDHVEIGALCTIDKGVTGDTIIGKSTKFDNHVHIGHDSIVGEMNLLASFAAIAGVSKTGREVTLWGQVGVSSDKVIGDKAVVQAQSGVSKDLDAGKVYFGSPAEEVRQKLRELAALRQLPELIEKWQQIESQLLGK